MFSNGRASPSTAHWRVMAVCCPFIYFSQISYLVSCEPQVENCCVKMDFLICLTDNIASAIFYYFNISFCWNETKPLIIGSLGKLICKDGQWGRKGNERSIILWTAEISELLLASMVNPPAKELCKLIAIGFQPARTQGKLLWMSLCL